MEAVELLQNSITATQDKVAELSENCPQWAARLPNKLRVILTKNLVS